VSRKYLAALAVAAVLILAGGLLVRRSLAPRTPARNAAAPPSEAAALRQLSQEGQLRRMAEFVAERVAAVAPLVVYVPEARAAGIRWRDGLLLSTRPDRPVVAFPRGVVDSVAPALEVTVDAGDSTPPGWLVAVGRRADGQVVSATGLVGGRAGTRCAGRDVETYVVSAPLPDPLAGAGLFALDGRLLGLVARCGDRLAALPARELIRLHAESESAAERLRAAYGLGLEPVDGLTRAYFRVDSGAVVTAVRRGSPADAAGLQAGDVIAFAGGAPRPGNLEALLAAPGDTLTVIRLRGRPTGAVRLSRDTAAVPDGAGIDVTPPRGVPVAAVAPGSPAASAGLRAGDRLLRVGAAAVRTPADARRLLSAAGAPGAAPTFVVFERDSVERGVLLVVPGTPGGPR
jgi:S1-C subfamily serine protease